MRLNPFKWFSKKQEPQQQTQSGQLQSPVTYEETLAANPYLSLTSQNVPNAGPTRDERYLHYLLHPCIPRQRPHLERHWILATEAVKHLQLTNIADPGTLHRILLLITDQFRIGRWDATEYFEQRQLKLFSMIMLLKSISYTRAPRERDALNENRQISVLRDDRTPPPRETGGFLGGMFYR